MDEQPLVERQRNEPATLFKEMAEAITHNAGQAFGGAAVVVAPGGAEPISLLMLDSSADIATFYATLQTRITLLLKGLEDQQRVATMPWGR